MKEYLVYLRPRKHISNWDMSHDNMRCNLSLKIQAQNKKEVREIVSEDHTYRNHVIDAIIVQ